MVLHVHMRLTGNANVYVASFEDTFERLNVKSVTISLPGFGHSSFCTGLSVYHWPQSDLLPILKKEGVAEFIVWGWSLGTLYAMSTAQFFTSTRYTGSIQVKVRMKVSLTRSLAFFMHRSLLLSSSIRRQPSLSNVFVISMSQLRSFIVDSFAVINVLLFIMLARMHSTVPPYLNLGGLKLSIKYFLSVIQYWQYKAHTFHLHPDTQNFPCLFWRTSWNQIARQIDFPKAFI